MYVKYIFATHECSIRVYRYKSIGSLRMPNQVYNHACSLYHTLPGFYAIILVTNVHSYSGNVLFLAQGPPKPSSRNRRSGFYLLNHTY